MRTIALITAFAALSATSLTAQVTTEPVGFNSVTCLPGSDTRCSVPLSPEIPFPAGVVSSVSTPVAGQLTIVPTATAPGWTTNQFASLYYVKMTSGAKAGMFYQILSNTATDVTVDLAGDAAAVVAADGFKICKFWTLATLFPPATQTTIVPSASNSGLARRTEVRFPDLTGTGINLATTRTFFLVGTEWREATASNANADNVILTPDSFFIVRHGSSSIVSATTYTVTGNVDLAPNTTGLNTLQAGKQDNPVTHGRPIPVSLANLDLISSGAFAGSNGQGGLARRDELLVYSNAVAGINKAASATYYYDSSSGNWKASGSNVISDSVEIGPAEGFVIRKYQTSGGSAVVSWQQTF